MGALDLSVIVPTYREAENLEPLATRLVAALQPTGWSFEILIVDDNSPDETRAVCERLAESAPLRLLVREQERGLSTAVLHGMREAQGDVFVVMDADLSHPPEVVPQLAAVVRDRQADFALGSRYVEGGSTDDDWGVGRWLNSKVATLLSLPLTSVRDPMSGFFAIRRESVESAAQLKPTGYKIGLELLVKCDCRTVAELPIHFHNRVHGESKLTIRQQFEFLWHLAQLYSFKMCGRHAA